MFLFGWSQLASLPFMHQFSLNNTEGGLLGSSYMAGFIVASPVFGELGS